MIDALYRIECLYYSGDETSSSNALSVPTSMLKDMYHAFPSNLSQILEEEERQSSRNSVEKESEKREEADLARGNLESGQRTDAINEEDHDQVDKSDVEHDTEKCAKDDNDNNNNDQEDNLERDKDDDESVVKPDISDEKTSNKRKISRT